MMGLIEITRPDRPCSECDQENARYSLELKIGEQRWIHLLCVQCLRHLRNRFIELDPHGTVPDPCPTPVVAETDLKSILGRLDILEGRIDKLQYEGQGTLDLPEDVPLTLPAGAQLRHVAVRWFDNDVTRKTKCSICGGSGGDDHGLGGDCGNCDGKGFV